MTRSHPRTALTSPATVLLVAIALVASLATAALAADTLPNSTVPSPTTAQVYENANGGGPWIYDMDVSGNTVVVGGDFTTVSDAPAGSPRMTRNFLFAFDRRTGEVSDTFVPAIDGIVNAVHITDDGKVLVAGEFRTVNGAAQRGIARLDLTTGQRDTSFTGTTSSGVLDMEVSDDEIIVGGRFTWAGGVRAPLLAALDPETGRGIPGFAFDIQGIVNPTAQDVQSTQVLEVDISPDGRWASMVGNQTTVDGQPRGQLALIDLDSYTLADWYVPEFGNWPCSTARNKLTYVMSADFAPDSSYIVTGTMGAYRNPSSGALCDTVARFEMPPTRTGGVTPTWADYTGGDSIFRVEATEAGIYAGGHQRWHNNPSPSRAGGGISGDNDGPGTVERHGLAVLDPTSGVPLSWYPNDHGVRPNRGFETIEAVGDLLLLGGDTRRIGNGGNREGIAIFSTAGGPANPLPEPKTLPAELHALGADGVLRASSFTGTSVGSAVAESGPGVDGTDWSGTDDGFLQHGQLTYFGTDTAYYRRSFGSGAVGSPTNLSATVGYVDDGALTPYDQPYGVDNVQAAGYVDGRIIYTRSDSTRLFSRWYSLESGIIGGVETTLDSSRDWRAQAAAMTVVGGRLVVAETTGSLVSYPLTSAAGRLTIDGGARTVVDGGGSGNDWATTRALFTTVGADTVRPNTTITEPASNGATVGGSTLLAGDATDDRAVTEVDLTVRADDGRYLQANGSLGSSAATITVPTVNSQQDVGAWSLDVDLPDGGYTLTARARDGAGNVDGSPATRTFQVVSTPPDSMITDPATGAVLASGPVTVTGEASAAVAGVGSVGVTVRERDTKAWLQPDGSFSASFARIDAELASPGAGQTGWSLDVELPAGRWAVTSRTVALDGEVEQDTPFSRFVTEDAVVISDDVVPDTTVTSPASGAAVATGTVRVSGGATDDSSGVASVGVAVRDVDAGTWLQDNGTWGGGFTYLSATVAAPGTTSTTWSIDVPLPSAGRYAVIPRATDAAGNDETDRPYHRFDTVAAPDDGVEPDTTITTPDARAVLPAGGVRIAGGATDDASGVTEVLVTVRSRTNLDWLQPDGSFSSSFALVPATVASPGSRSTSWTLDVTLPADDWAVTARGVDAGGNTESSRPWQPFTTQ